MTLLAAIVLIGIPLCRKKAGKAIYCGIAGFVLFFMAAVRKYTGYDYNLYGQIFLDYLRYPDRKVYAHRFEKGIAMPMRLLGNLFFDDYQTMFVVFAFVIALMLMLILYKTSDRPYLGVFFFLTMGMYFNTMNFMRQMIAAFIVVLGMRYIKTNQFFRYTLVVLFASCFHLSALIMIPFYFIMKIKFNYITLAIYSGLGALAFIFSMEIMQSFTLSRLFVQRYSGPEGRGELNGSTWPLYTVFFGLCFLFVLLFRKRLIEKDPFNNVWIWCAFFAFYFEALGLKHNILARLEMPFLIACGTVILPRTVECMLEWFRSKFPEDRRKRIISSAAAVGSAAIICVGMYGYMIEHNYNGVNPYQTIWYAVWEDPRK